MTSVLFCIPLKKDCLMQYELFVKETVQRAIEYKEMLTRYDIYDAKLWHKNISDRDFVFVYHDIGPHFKEKMASWDTSNHPFDIWFRNSIMAVYDIEYAAGMEQPRLLADFNQ